MIGMCHVKCSVGLSDGDGDCIIKTAIFSNDLYAISKHLKKIAQRVRDTKVNTITRNIVSRFL